MKLTPVQHALFLSGLLLMLAQLFHPSIGLPEWLSNVCFLGAMVCMCAFIYSRKRSISRSPTKSTLAPNAKRKRLIVAVASLAFGAATFPLVAPYTGINAPLSALVMAGIATFIIGVLVVVFAFRKLP